MHLVAREENSRTLPSLLVTGASGLVGRNFIDSVKEQFYIYAVGRRSQREAEVPVHDNIRWLRCDIADGQAVSRLFQNLGGEAIIEFIFHFAGYYDFTYRDDPEYRRTNVDGTRHILENAEGLGLKRFIFSSSLAVTDFSKPGVVINEQSPPDGDYPYSRSKREAEELVASYSTRFPCTIARLAAVYSDWCEYAPLYVSIRNWLSGGVLSRFIAGRGETALPYLHVQDLNAFWLRLIRMHGKLSDFDILAASHSGCVSHNELNAAAAQCYDERPERPLHIPVWLATAGVALRRVFGIAIGRPPFERPWMMRYIDRRMVVDASNTQRLLEWEPKPRFHIMRRMLFLIENMKRDPATWEMKNLAMTKGEIATRPGLKIYNAMMKIKDGLVEEHVAYLKDSENRELYPSYQRIDRADLRLRSELLFTMLESSIRLGDHLSILNYANYLARRRYEEGFRFEEVSGALEHLAHSVEEALQAYPGLQALRARIRFEIVTTMQLILDEIEDTYENLAAAEAGEGI